MKRKDPSSATHAGLDEVLLIYGADQTRWPAATRHAYADFLANDTVAARMVQEAAALDRLLDEAPTAASADVAALSDRIAAAALKSPRLKAVATPKAASRPAQSPAYGRRVTGLALAASLALGILAGQSTMLSNAADDVLALTSFDGASDGGASQLASSEGVATLLDEDFL